MSSKTEVASEIQHAARALAEARRWIDQAYGDMHKIKGGAPAQHELEGVNLHVIACQSTLVGLARRI